MKILFISPDIEEKARGINMILKSLIESAKADGHEVGLLVGYPSGSEFDKSEIISDKLEHLQAQHYLREGRDSFKYVTNHVFGRRVIAKSILRMSVFKSKTIKVNQEYLEGHEGLLNSIDFVVKSPYIYQFLVYGYKFLPQLLLKRIVKKNKVDLAVFASPSIISNKKISTKVAHFVHDTMPIEMVEAPPDNNTPARYARQFYSTCTNSDVIFTNSKDTASKVLAVEKDANVHVLYGTASAQNDELETSVILDNKGLKKDHFLFFTSTLEKRKNVINLMNAYSTIADTIDMPLVIAGGKGYGYEEIMLRYNEFGQHIKDRIMFLGYISEADKYELYKNCFSFVFPSLYEGIGLILIEAMQSGAPVITSRRGALPEAAGEAALYIENPYDPGEISSAILKLIDSPKLRKKMIEEGYKQHENFTPDKFSKRFTKALDSIT